MADSWWIADFAGMSVSFMVTLLTILVMGFAFLKVIGMMVMGDLGLLPGIGALAILLGIFALTIWSKSMVVAIAAFAVMAGLMAFFPFAESQLEALSLREIDVESLDKLFRTASQRPDNFAVRFEIARSIYGLGLPGHAIAIVETTLASLSTVKDDVQNRSLRDVFRGAEFEAKQWRRTLHDPDAFRPVSCPRCGHSNQPGLLACGGCQGPYLLDLARKLDVRSKFIGKLVFGWALIAALFVAVAAVAPTMSRIALAIAILVALILVGGILAWLFRPPKLGMSAGRTGSP
jgi:hypothetical protein